MAAIVNIYNRHVYQHNRKKNRKNPKIEFDHISYPYVYKNVLTYISVLFVMKNGVKQQSILSFSTINCKKNLTRFLGSSHKITVVVEIVFLDG